MAAWASSRGGQVVAMVKGLGAGGCPLLSKMREGGGSLWELLAGMQA